MEPESVVVAKQKCTDYRKRLIFMVFFFSLYILYIFVWIQNDCLANTVFALNPSKSVINTRPDHQLGAYPNEPLRWAPI